ncbi:prepilin-type N-terminal cleavage/methylation domain-containing protein [Dactylosporangium siamense]|uniref:Prepilin-type N-terminal cleavage/methylation domain-containing protein n=1 Tax=Dactylosporangium siamense TaxID=685454 RepID=A0A919PJK6_9ACTN|nr:prepilin-type N-terminal cleavage/methylation domain-containing protein [Dactylosporangium siamense]GIG45961.1 hypothetical protein Dsi01nite_040020 [Dactylosporangium siamense]
MTETLRRMQKKRAAGESGFTLVELLVVVVIIGVLVAIAVPMYLNYRKGASNKSAESDVRAAVSAIEQFYTENGNTYPANTKSPKAGENIVFDSNPTGAVKQTGTVSPGNILAYRLINASTYRICGRNEEGKVNYVYTSATGGSVKKWGTDETKTAQDCADSDT